jgi:8-oxo-dGTP pyrophosphatase MutT (NUDIX family)
LKKTHENADHPDYFLSVIIVLAEFLNRMTTMHANSSSGRAKIATLEQVSAGGVAFRHGVSAMEIAIVSVGAQSRWQLPKGLIDAGEIPVHAALREVREEAGIETTMVAPLDTIEYWYVGNKGQQRVRFHKFVHFFLLAYRAGCVDAHDHEVNEARWVTLEKAKMMLVFKSERQVLEKAEAMLKTLNA